MAPSPIARLESANAHAVMERVAEAGLIERGAVAVISVAAIRERAADRWFRKRDDVWSYVTKKLGEHLSFADIHHRLNETDFLLAMTSEHGAAVQGVALRVLEEVLAHFLGAAEMPDIKIQTVTRFSPDGLTCAPLDPRAIQRAPVYLDDPQPAFRKSIDPLEERKKTPVSFVAAGGLAMRIDFAVEPVISLRHEVTAALRIEPTVRHIPTDTVIPARNFARLSDEDLYFIDRAAIDYASLYLADGRSAGQPPMVIPASFRTMGARKGRNALMLASGGVADVLKSSVIVELIDVDHGTPASRLTEVIGLITSLCRAVLIRLRPAKDIMAPARGVKVQGLTLDGADLGQSDAQIAAAILAFGEQARGQAPLLGVQGLPANGFFQVAGVAGLTHGSVRMPPKVEDAAA